MEISPAHVRTLQEIVRWGSFSRAADRLSLSQPAVSHHIRHLEEVVGLPLLERVGKRALPTRAGEVLLEHAGRAIAELEAGYQAVQRLRGAVAGRVRLGTGATASIYLLPTLLRRLRVRYPELELVVVTGNAPEIVGKVVAHELDLAIASLPVSRRHLAVAPFFDDALVTIAAPEGRWPRQPLTPSALAAHPLIVYESGGTIRRIIDAWFRRGGAVPRIAMELGNVEAIKKLVGAGLGIAITSGITVRAEGRAGRLHVMPLRPPLVRSLGVVRRRDKPLGPALTTVLAALDRLAATLASQGAQPSTGPIVRRVSSERGLVRTKSTTERSRGSRGPVSP
jgi:DNA-binding transcriptional LysR family regulator